MPVYIASPFLRYLAALSVAAASICADTATQNFERLCAGCHGPLGSGGRAPALSGGMRRVSDVAGLESMIRAGIPGTEMPPTPANRLGNADLKELAAWIWALRQGPAATEAAQFHKGGEIFRGKGNCTRCHTIGAEGTPFGPDLTLVGQRRSSAYLRTAILDPQADISDSFENYQWYIDIPDNFLQVRVVTKAGQKLTAARVNEDAFSIQLRDVQGKLHSFLKSELAQLEKDWGKSAMPDYKGILTETEIIDLVAFLAAQRRSR
jgi:cytochrome c oxidase cbb3-type subunit 3